MTDSPTTDSRNVFGTRWLRALMLMTCALIPAAAAGAATAQSALGMGFAAQSLRGSFATNGLETSDPVGIVVHPQITKDADGNTYTQYVIKLAAGSATAHGLCVAETMSMLGQTFTVLIESDDDAVQVSGIWGNLHSATTSLYGTGNVKINKNAADVSVNGESLGGLLGELGIEAGGATMGPTRGTLQAAYVKVADISKVSARLVQGEVGCA